MVKKLKSFLFSNKSTGQTIAKNAFWLFFGEGVGRIFRAIIIIYAARVMGAEALGVFSYVITLAAFFTIFADIGISGLLTKEVARNPDKRKEYLSTSFYLKLGISLILAVVAVFGAPYLAREPIIKNLIPLVALMFFFDGMRNFIFAVNRAFEKMELEAGCTIFTNLSIIFFTFSFLFVSQTPEAMIWGYIAGVFVGLAYSIWVLRKELSRIFFNFKKNLVWPIFKEAWPLGLSGFLGSIMINTDILMLEWMMSVSIVGIYSAVQKPIMLLYFVPNIICAALFPAMAKKAKQDNIGFKHLMEKSLAVMMLIALPITVLGFYFSADILNLLYGSEYIVGTSTMQILFLTLPFVFVGLVASNALFAYDQQKKFITYLILGAGGNIVLNYFFIKLFGMPGVALATLITQVIAVSYLWLTMKKVNYFSLKKRFGKIIISTLLSLGVAIALSFLEAGFIISIITACITYIALLFALKEPEVKSINNLFCN